MFKLLNWGSDNILTSPGLWTYEVYLLILNVVVNLLIILILDSSSEFMGRFFWALMEAKWACLYWASGPMIGITSYEYDRTISDLSPWTQSPLSSVSPVFFAWCESRLVSSRLG